MLPRLCRPGAWSRRGWWVTLGRSPELHDFRFLLCLEWSGLAISKRPPSSKTLRSLELTPISEDLSSYYSEENYSCGYETQNVKTLQMLPFQQQCVHRIFLAAEGDVREGRKAVCQQWA